VKLKKNYAAFSAVLLSGAMASLYFITYAAYDFYQFIPQLMAFVLMVLFTAFTVFAALAIQTTGNCHHWISGCLRCSLSIE
jgi:uncharacterized membrane protein